MVTYEKIKSRFSRNWSLRNRGQAFTKIGGEFVANMAFGKKSKIFKTRLGISVVSGISLLLGAYTHTSTFIFCIVY
ncbi:hypothetical protein N405_04300 [Helicobacter pylori FD568]|nr:hypothetical protein N405_04300 [Helicobacter pylori FD568]